MRNLFDLEVNQFREKTEEVGRWFGGWGDGTCGCFILPSPVDGAAMRAIASMGEGWDHVSVSRRSRPPNWLEMSLVKDLFFKPDETAMQLHVPRDDHINNAVNCLHLWRPQREAIPRPPAILVGVK